MGCEGADILIVTADAGACEIIARALAAKGYAARSSSCPECLASMEQRLPDLLVLDDCSGGGSSVELLRRLRLRWPEHQLPVIVMSALSTTEDVVAGFNAGANDYVRKPVNVAILMARIDACLKIRSLSLTHRRAQELAEANAALAAEITERRRVEEELRLSEERFEKAFRASADGVVLSQRETGKIIDANDSFLKMFGFSRQEVIGRSSLELSLIAHPPDREAAVEQVRRTGVLRDFERPGRRKNGELFPVAVSVDPIVIAGVPCVLTIVRDNTERQRWREAMQNAHEELEKRVAERTAELELAVAALRESEERFRLMADNAPMMLWIDDCKGACLFLNRAWLTYTGRTMEQELGFGWVQSVHPEDRARCLEAFEAGRKAMRPVEVEYRLRRRDGQYGWILDRSLPRTGPDGNFQGFIGSCIDITDRREAADLLRRANEELDRRVKERTAELHESNQMLRQEVAERRAATQRLLAYQERLRALAAQVALAEEQERRRIARGLHDEIGQSLALMKMRLGSLPQKGDDPDRARNIEEIRAALEKSIQHIRSLTFELGSRILYEFGIETALENLCEEVQKQGVRASFEDDRAAKPLDEEVRLIVYQAARELLHNVLKHAGAKRVRLSISREGERVRVEIVDDGIGFEPQKLAADFSRSGGFGLFNIRERLDYVGGRLEIESAPSHGTRMIIQAPLQRRHRSADGAGLQSVPT